MNSFYTHEDTQKIRPKYERRVKLYMFVQSCYPRLDRETLRPLAQSPQSKAEWSAGEGRGGEERCYCAVCRFIVLSTLVFSLVLCFDNATNHYNVLKCTMILLCHGMWDV